MKVLTKELILESNGRRVTYHNITEQVKAFVEVFVKKWWGWSQAASWLTSCETAPP